MWKSTTIFCISKGWFRSNKLSWEISSVWDDFLTLCVLPGRWWRHHGRRFRVSHAKRHPTREPAKSTLHQNERFHIPPTIKKYNSAQCRLLLLISIFSFSTYKSRISVISCKPQTWFSIFTFKPDPFSPYSFVKKKNNCYFYPQIAVQLMFVLSIPAAADNNPKWVSLNSRWPWICMPAYVGPLCGPPGLSVSPDHIPLTCGSINYCNNQFLISRTATWRCPTTKGEFSLGLCWSNDEVSRFCSISGLLKFKSSQRKHHFVT